MDLPRGMTVADAERLQRWPWALVDLRLDQRRKHGILGEGRYRPHLVFGDTDEHGFVYWGVSVWLYDEAVEPGESGQAFVTFLYRIDEPPPPLCRPGAYFEIREGVAIVGSGHVIECGSGGDAWPFPRHTDPV